MAARPFISVTHDDGVTWYIPEGCEGVRTKTSLALVRQLFALHKKSKELPTTTAVEFVGRP